MAAVGSHGGFYTESIYIPSPSPELVNGAKADPSSCLKFPNSWKLLSRTLLTPTSLVLTSLLFEFQPLSPNNRARDVSFLYRSPLSLGKGGEEKRKKPAFCSAPSPGSEGSFKGWEGALITRAFCREPKHVRAAPPSDPRPAETASRATLLSPSWALRSASLSSRHFLVFLQTGGGCFRTAGVSCQRLVGGGISRAMHQLPSP